MTFSKANSGQPHVVVARGTWFPGREPELEGEPIPPEVLKGLERQVCMISGDKGSVSYDRVDVRYTVEFEAMPEVDSPAPKC